MKAGSEQGGVIARLGTKNPLFTRTGMPDCHSKWSSHVMSRVGNFTARRTTQENKGLKLGG